MDALDLAKQNSQICKLIEDNIERYVSKARYAKEEEARKFFEDIVDEVTTRKLNGHPCFLDWMHSSVDLEKEFSQAVYDAFDPTPVIGLGVTEVLYSDYNAYTIVKVLTPKKVIIKENKVNRNGWGENEVIDELIEGSEEIITLRRGGSWLREGDKKERGCVVFSLGWQRSYRDPEF